MLYFLTLFVVFAGTAFSSEDITTKLERRDVGQSFQKQLSALLPFNIANKSVCTTPPCLDGLDSSLCSTFFTPNSRTEFGTILTHFTSCYVKGFCNTNFVNRSLYNVNVTLPTPTGYNGQCYLYGPKMDFTFNLTSAAPGIVEYATPSYFGSIAYTYTFTGLSVRCQPCPSPTAAPPTMPPAGNPTMPPAGAPTMPPAGATEEPCDDDNQDGGGQQSNCCPNDLLPEVLCLVENLLCSLNLNILLSGCDCSCTSGKRGLAPESALFEGQLLSERQAAAERGLSERQAAAESMPFESVVSAVQTISFRQYLAFRVPYPPYYDLGSIHESTSVSLGAQVPSQYQADLIAGIQGVFNDFNVYYYLLFYFNTITRDLILSFYKTCPGAV